MSMENTNNPKRNEDSLVFVLQSLQPASAENRIIINTLHADKNTVFPKLLK